MKKNKYSFEHSFNANWVTPLVWRLGKQTTNTERENFQSSQSLETISLKQTIVNIDSWLLVRGCLLSLETKQKFFRKIDRNNTKVTN